MKLYISDLHFYHESLNEGLDKRHFSSVREMNDTLVEKWNSKVQGGDQIIVLGDLFWSKEPEEVNRILRKLKGKICLVEGNHDNRWLKKEGVDLNRFEWIRPYAELDDKGRIVIASHYPTFCYNHQFLKMPDGSDRTYMLYGHVHDTHDEVLVNQFQEITRATTLKGSQAERRIPCHMINCFCMFSDYTPLSLDEWIAVDEKRRSTMKVDVPTQLIEDEF